MAHGPWPLSNSTVTDASFTTSKSLPCSHHVHLSQQQLQRVVAMLRAMMICFRFGQESLGMTPTITAEVVNTTREPIRPGGQYFTYMLHDAHSQLTNAASRNSSRHWRFSGLHFMDGHHTGNINAILNKVLPGMWDYTLWVSLFTVSIATIKDEWHSIGSDLT